MTNLITFPEDITLGGWGNVGFINTADDVALAPDGTMTAASIVVDSGGGSTVGSVSFTVVVDVATQYCMSAFVKPIQNDEFAWRTQGFTTPNNIQSYFELAPSSVHTVAFDDAGVEDFPDGWVRCHSVITTDPVDSTGAIRMTLAKDNSISVPRDGNSGVLVWGMVMELGDTPSPYTSEAGILVSNGRRNIIPISRRTAKQMNVKQRIGKARDTLRGHFE